MNTPDPRADIVARALKVADGASDPMLAGAVSLCRRAATANKEHREAEAAVAQLRAELRMCENLVVGAVAQKELLVDLLVEHVAAQTAPASPPTPPVPAVVVEDAPPVVVTQEVPAMANPFDRNVPRDG